MGQVVSFQVVVDVFLVEYLLKWVNLRPWS